jgi:hypothetical protein
MRYSLLIVVCCVILTYTLDDNTAQQFEQVKQWLINHNAFISSKVSIINNNNNRYMIANDNIEQDEHILFIPDQLNLNVINPIISKTCSLVQYSHVAKATECLVYFLTLDSLNDNSIFKLYYNYLPKSFNDFPIYYTDNNDIRLIEQSGLYKEYYKLQTKINSGYKEIQSFLPSNVTYEQYKFWYVMVMSRTFSRMFYNNDIPTLVPYLDLINHANNQFDNANYYYDEGRKGFCLQAMKAISKNEEITIMYNYHLNNILLLSKYGFILKDNSNQIGFYITINNNSYYLNGYFFQKAIMELKSSIQRDFPSMSTNDILYEIRDTLKQRKDNLKHIRTNNTLLKTVLEEEYRTAYAFLDAVNELI